MEHVVIRHKQKPENAYPVLKKLMLEIFVRNNYGA